MKKPIPAVMAALSVVLSTAAQAQDPAPGRATIDVQAGLAGYHSTAVGSAGSQDYGSYGSVTSSSASQYANSTSAAGPGIKAELRYRFPDDAMIIEANGGTSLLVPNAKGTADAALRIREGGQIGGAGALEYTLRPEYTNLTVAGGGNLSLEDAGHVTAQAVLGSIGDRVQGVSAAKFGARVLSEQNIGNIVTLQEAIEAGFLSNLRADHKSGFWGAKAGDYNAVHGNYFTASLVAKAKLGQTWYLALETSYLGTSLAKSHTIYVDQGNTGFLGLPTGANLTHADQSDGTVHAVSATVDVGAHF